ncbi:ABC-2 type transport system ATP-binding protein [Clostridium beijerinckii]|uniref:ABC-2 type transport system ATP-binding protein n=1 Tax=Clostridium beijerinckii TaxID=1520 RepID=A0AAX0AWX0_CLOBE|nr:ABC-2 type transport system ATP-binding protein [Clostridium beijerinckii]NYC72037.1 ABC-2 type transport system ATP-binding protein [Clostridium beijerinckii]
MNEFILETKNLCKNFKKQEAVKDISVLVKKNSIYGLLGPNGAGKSTLLKMVTGMLRPNLGEILFDGHKWGRKDLREIGSLIESAPLYENLTAKENLSEKLGGAKVVIELPILFN